MGGRLALVVGSECAALGELGFTDSLAGGLYAGLREAGGWEAATEADGPVLDPTAAQLVSAVDVAFERASQRAATLLVAFIGHGMATNSGDFYLMAHDSPSPPRSDNAFHLTQGIRERLNTSALDGLIVLVDACETEQGVRGAARLWTGPLARSSGRMELLVAAGDGPAHAGCFTRTMLSTFEAGLPRRGENLLPSDLVDPVARGCVLQQPLHLSFTAGTVTMSPGGDAGLWLVPNIARRKDALTGRPGAGVVDQLTRRLLLTDAMRESLAEVIDSGSHRLRAVVGAAGCGKSTLMALLVRPSVAEGLSIVAEYVTAAVFLTTSSTIEAVAEELSAQLSERVPGYAEALGDARSRGDTAELDAFDRHVRYPLAAVSRPGGRITLVLDGLDQPATGSRELLVAAVSALTRDDDLRYVRVITGIRLGSGIETDPALAHMHRVELAEPREADIDALVWAERRELVPLGPLGASGPRVDPGAPGAGSYERLPARRKGRLPDDTDWDKGWLDKPVDEPEDTRPAAVGGWLSARLQSEVSPWLGAPAVGNGTRLDDVVAKRVRSALYIDRTGAVGRVIPLLAVLAAAGAGPVLPIGLLTAAMKSLGFDTGPHRLRNVVVSLGALVTRSHPGTTREALGIAHPAFLSELLVQCARYGMRVEDAHRAIIAATKGSAEAAEYARTSLARHYLECGDSAAALSHLESHETASAADNRDLWSTWLPPIVAAVGADHPDTLRAREYHAMRRADSGDLTGAAEEQQRLLADRLRLLGPDHPDTIATRDRLSHWRSHLGSTHETSTPSTSPAHPRTPGPPDPR
ncbi:AAA ATPase-like protein [Nocardia tenerifensis]|uniref:AAA ATPase-like protein n=1 Tax=Nocardia tenerifensis TaxID=228006 RepID=A0A318K8Q5_9NOCA|nr:ATP-binding protein [Nocardia tenerifensis]PXX70688.1 AAA ATPase-like protein [Nocardia tenerifensis]